MSTFTDVVSSGVLNKSSERAHGGIVSRLIGAAISRCFFFVFGPPD